MEICEKLYHNCSFGSVSRRLYGICVALLILCMIAAGSRAETVAPGAVGMPAGEGACEDGREGRTIPAGKMAAASIADHLSDAVEEIRGSLYDESVRALDFSSGKTAPPSEISTNTEAVPEYPKSRTETGKTSHAGIQEEGALGPVISTVPDGPEDSPGAEEGAGKVETVPGSSAENPAKPEEKPADSESSSGTELLAVDGFYVDENGTICGIEDIHAAVSNGVLRLPSENCSSVSAAAFTNIPSGIIEVYVPANITRIEEGAFSGLMEAEWFSADPSGTYTSMDGVLVAENGTCIVAFPPGRTGIYQIPPQVMTIAPGAFKGSMLSKIDVRSSGVKDTENIPEGIGIL